MLIKDKFTEKLTGKLYQTENPLTFEYITYNGDELDLQELQLLNSQGYLFHSSQTDIEMDMDSDYLEDLYETMNIYYFSFIENLTDLNANHPF